MGEIRLTVVTPTFNPGPRLQRCIDSVAAQARADVEHVVVDGASTDGTVDLLRRHPGVRWISEPDGGQSDAINKGFRMASGEIVGWLNGDDELAPDALDRVLEAFEQPGVGWVFGDVKVVHEGGVQIARPPWPLRPHHFWTQNPVAQPGSFFARWAMERIGPVDTGLHFGMDLDLWLRFLAAEVPYAYVPHVLAVFEVHDASKSGSVTMGDFVADFGLARYKNGHDRGAAASFGRAAALAAAAAGDRSMARVAREYERLLAVKGVDPARLSWSLASGAARVELGVLGVKRRRGLEVLHLLHPDAWRFPESRVRLMEATGRLVRQIRTGEHSPQAMVP